MDLREQTFGIEIEMTGLSRDMAGEAVASFFGTQCRYVGGTYDEYQARDQQDRVWKLVYDSSIRGEQLTSRGSLSGNSSYRVELVSPICTYEDIETVQNLVRVLRNEGAMVNDSTGIHIHIGAKPFNAPQLRNLVNIMASKEDLIYQALQVERHRENNYCKKTDQTFLEKLNLQKPKTREEFKNIWYNGEDGSRRHYHNSRYHCLNLHSVFQKNTIEFRAFNSEMNPGKIKAYIQFCMAITAQAHTQKSASPIKTQTPNEKYTFRTWLLRLGMIGDEFKETRKHLLGNLEGNIAWRDPEQAVAQKERLRARQELKQHEAQQPEEQPQQEAQAPDQEPGFSMTMQ